MLIYFFITVGIPPPPPYIVINGTILSSPFVMQFSMYNVNSNFKRTVIVFSFKARDFHVRRWELKITNLNNAECRITKSAMGIFLRTNYMYLI